MIKAESLVKNYNDLEVIKNISFSVNKGEILGFLGPNGAGKTTVMRMIAGFHLPDSGTIKIINEELNEESVELKNLIGYLPENVPLYADMTPLEFLSFIAEVRLVRKTNSRSSRNSETKEIVEKTLALCGLEHRKDQRIETLSRGYKQRVGFAQAVLHNPPVLILDEPLTGLDPNQIIEMRNLIRKLGKEKTIIFSTHILNEAESICTNYLILHEGEIAAQGLMSDKEKSLEEIFINLAGKRNE